MLTGRTTPSSPLNTALVRDGAFIRVAAGARVERPINLVFVTSSGETPIWPAVRNLIIAGESSELRVVETYLGSGDAATSPTP